MLDFLTRWLSKARSSSADSQTDDAEAPGLPLPVVAEQSTSKWKGRDLQLVGTSAISHPIPRSSPLSLTGFDAPDHRGPWQYPYPNSLPGPARAGPSNVAWISSTEDEDDGDEKAFPVTLPQSVPPAVVRLPSQTKLFPIGRSVSSPPTSPMRDSPSSSSSSSSGIPSPRWNLKLNTNPTFSQSTHSLRLDYPAYATTDTDVYRHAYNYPLAKQLSPIAEQDYFSPTSLRGSAKLLPSSSGLLNGSTPSVTYSISNTTNASPGGSQKSDITRPSPSYSVSHPFITRQLNRTISQTSSRTHVSTSSLPRLSNKSSEPPSIPPLNLAPPFPGPHPSREGSGPPLRPRRSTVIAMPTITGSSESGPNIDDEYGADEDLESLHAESFVTASDDMGDGNGARDETDDLADATLDTEPSMQDIPITPVADAAERHSAAGSGASQLPSVSESFIGRRWERDAALGSGVVTFRAKRQWLTYTPAFWAFWLGFVCPFLWLIGGWHFTRFGEQPPRLTFWEFYFNAGYWKEKFCMGKRRKTQQGGCAEAGGTEQTAKQQQQQHRLPRWVTEKQSSDDGRMRLQDPKRSLRGISFGYPFIPRPVAARRSAVQAEAEACFMA
ncbi:hypothetical protein LshimejAT787_0703380 [Lyophyllum shimeji]|uniref:Uncharacterized protein n=1 Tax=Lyophyllum shimeji TaxID=47721 RepID=A0A9P3PQP8_LYOSH|nr:hypothetical protein LshimejAT787_0703380 [Lyophyllum shimeji]